MLKLSKEVLDRIKNDEIRKAKKDREDYEETEWEFDSPWGSGYGEESNDEVVGSDEEEDKYLFK